MRNRSHIIFLLSLLVLGFISCSPAEKPAPEQVTTVDSLGSDPLRRDSTIAVPVIDSLSMQKATESFRGTYNGEQILFSHTNFQTYTLSTAGLLTSGHLNTERGYGDDRSATVYILDDDKPKKEQKYFVRTPRGTIYMLDQGRYVVDDAIFEPVSTKVKPVAVKKTVVAEPVKKAVVPVKKKVSVKKHVAAKSAKKKRSAKKHVSKKPAHKDTIQKSTTVKKTSSKKIRKKIVKKKKPVKKSRKKKSRKKKAVQPEQ